VWPALAALLAVIAAAGCAPAPSVAVTPTVSAAPVVATPAPVLAGLCGAAACPRPRSPYVVGMQTDPSPMVVLRPTTFILRITDPTGKPLNGLSVSLFAVHAEDIHEDVGPARAEQLDAGTFRAEMILRKYGNYTVIATLNGPSGEGEHVFNFDTQL
jgi:hypothetical protein